MTHEEENIRPGGKWEKNQHNKVWKNETQGKKYDSEGENNMIIIRQEGKDADKK